LGAETARRQSCEIRHEPPIPAGRARYQGSPRTADAGEGGRAPQTVVLDITEHERIRDYELLGRVLADYRNEGIRFALDDVGEGHSTLELIAASSSEYLKLGRSLTMTSSRLGSRRVIDATMSFARISGAMVIAEGVENEYVADMMKAVGITLGQGFGLGKPTMASDVEDVAAALLDRAALSGLRPRSAYLFAGEGRR
jgi:EAL domain-containing protein (putative c-di-GMP-specific phosphodiesterase class I)